MPVLGWGPILRIPFVYCVSSNKVQSKEVLSGFSFFGVQNLNLFLLYLNLKFPEFMDKLDWV